MRKQTETVTKLSWEKGKGTFMQITLLHHCSHPTFTETWTVSTAFPFGREVVSWYIHSPLPTFLYTRPHVLALSTLRSSDTVLSLQTFLLPNLVGFLFHSLGGFPWPFSDTLNPHTLKGNTERPSKRYFYFVFSLRHLSYSVAKWVRLALLAT